MKKVDRKLAIKALLNLQHQAFGHDKGSGEAYWEWAEEMELCPPYDPDDPNFESNRDNWPPDFFELLMAVGISPQEIYGLMPGLNRKIFPKEMCIAYGFTLPEASTHDEQETR